MAFHGNRWHDFGTYQLDCNEMDLCPISVFSKKSHPFLTNLPQSQLNSPCLATSTPRKSRSFSIWVRYFKWQRPPSRRCWSCLQWTQSQHHTQAVLHAWFTFFFPEHHLIGFSAGNKSHPYWSHTITMPHWLWWSMSVGKCSVHKWYTADIVPKGKPNWSQRSCFICRNAENKSYPYWACTITMSHWLWWSMSVGKCSGCQSVSKAALIPFVIHNTRDG